MVRNPFGWPLLISQVGVDEIWPIQLLVAFSAQNAIFAIFSGLRGVVMIGAFRTPQISSKTLL